MKVIDTNILARYFLEVEDNPKSTRQKIISARILSQPVYIPITVILEFEWVMRGVYKLEKQQIFEILNILLGLPTVTIEAHDDVSKALMLFNEGMDFADALHLSHSLGYDGFVTFDNKFYKRASNLGFEIELAQE